MSLQAPARVYTVQSLGSVRAGQCLCNIFSISQYPSPSVCVRVPSVLMICRTHPLPLPSGPVDQLCGRAQHSSCCAFRTLPLLPSVCPNVNLLINQSVFIINMYTTPVCYIELCPLPLPFCLSLSPCLVLIITLSVPLRSVTCVVHLTSCVCPFPACGL